MPLLLHEADVRALLTMPMAIEAVEASFRRLAEGAALVHPRQRIHFSDSAFLHYMAAGDNAGGYLGLKIYTSVAGRLRFLVPLFAARTGELLALIEADYLGQMRTGAASGVATKYMAREDATTCGILGSGLQARTQLEAVAEVRVLDSVRVFSREEARRTQFAQEMSAKLGLPVKAVNSAEQAARGQDIVVVATNASLPVLLGRWLAPGTHVNAIGANFPQKRELDEDAVNIADIIAVDSRQQSRQEAGDLLAVFGTEDRRWNAVHELHEIVSHRVPGREDSRQVTLFKSNGIAIWDVAVGAAVYERAVAEGRGEKIPMWQESA